jgi:aspartate/methionine/tyrosine aminotransferase
MSHIYFFRRRVSTDSFIPTPKTGKGDEQRQRIETNRPTTRQLPSHFNEVKILQVKLFKLEAFFEDYEHSHGMHILGGSDAEALSVQELLDISRASVDFSKINLGYYDGKGVESLRRAIADSYPGTGLTPENILITLGGSEAIFLAIHTLVRPGDEVLVCRPAYQALYEMAEAAGAKLSFYDYARQNEFAPNTDTILSALRQPKPPKVLIINTPHNPTGHSLDEAALKEILHLAREAGTSVVVDEVFSGVWIDFTEPVPSAISLEPESIVIGCLSKTYGLAGLRIGWLAAPKEFIRRCINLRYYTSLCPPAIVQQLGEIAIRNSVIILARNQEIVNENYGHALTWLKAHQEFFDWVTPMAGLVMLLRLKIAVDTEKFARRLADSLNVFLLPCTVGFGMEEGYLRLGLGRDPKELRIGLDLISQYLHSGNWQSLSEKAK